MSNTSSFQQTPQKYKTGQISATAVNRRTKWVGNVSNVIWSFIFSNIFISFFINARLIWAPSSSEALVSLAAATVSEEQIRQAGDQKETHHHGPDDNGNDPLVIVGPTLHFWNRQTEKASVVLNVFLFKTDTSWYLYQLIIAWVWNKVGLIVHRPPTFPILSFVQGESLDLQRNQLDLQQRRHQKLILRLALEALSVGCLEHLVVGHQTWISLIWRDKDTKQLLSPDSNRNVTRVRGRSRLSPYWRTFCRQAWETDEHSAWWQRKLSFPGGKNDEVSNRCII